MMEHLARGEPATKADLEDAEKGLRQEIVLLRRDLGALDRDLRQEIGGVDKSLRHEIGLVRKDLEIVEERLRREMHQGFGGLRKEMAAQIATQTRVLMFSTLSAVVAVGGVAVAAGRFA